MSNAEEAQRAAEFERKLAERIADLRERCGLPPKPQPQPKAAMPVVPLAVAERSHRQSAGRLLERHRAETGAEQNRRLLAEGRAEARAQGAAERVQAAIDFWMEQKLAAEQAEREFRRGLDPCRVGLYGPVPWEGEER